MGRPPWPALWLALLGALLRRSGAKPSDTCNRHREVLTAPWGIITDGNDSYRNDSHCEWLIRANSSQLYITLRFHEMETECAYDHVFVYDGDSYDSPLLGTFSGKTLPAPVTAVSGSMLVLLYSDTNYVLKGFVAEYSATPCPANCSGHGSCFRGACVCDRLWAGSDCASPACPDRCHADRGRGNCSAPCGAVPQCCRCAPGFAGLSCSLPEHPDDAAAGWHLLWRGEPFRGRAGHAGVYLPFTDQLFVFGGRAFGRVLGDFLVYNFNDSAWHDLSDASPRPAPRWGHAMAPYAHTVALHGGELADGSLSPELWLYHVARRRWTLQPASPAGRRPPALALHSFTPGDGSWLYVFGGRREGGAFSGDLWRVSPRAEARWERLARGGAPPSVGHAAAFHAESRSLLIHGGVVVDYARFSKLSAALWGFHVDAGTWTRFRWAPRGGGEPPTERAFHSAAMVGSYLLLFGGHVHRHSFEERCFDDGLYLFHLRCRKWVAFDLVVGDLPGQGWAGRCPGVHSHVAALRRGHTLLVLGGYRGRMTSDLWAFLLPTPVTHAYSHSASGACIRWVPRRRRRGRPPFPSGR